MEEYDLAILADHEQEEATRAFFHNNNLTFDQIAICQENSAGLIKRLF